MTKLANLRLDDVGKVLCSHPMMRDPRWDATCTRVATHVAVAPAIMGTGDSSGYDVPLCAVHAGGWNRANDRAGRIANERVERIADRLPLYVSQITDLVRDNARAIAAVRRRRPRREVG